VQVSDDFAEAPAQAPVAFAEPISVSSSDVTEGIERYYDAATQGRRRLDGRSAAKEALQESKSAHEPVLLSSEDMGNDLSVKNTLRLSTSHLSFRWLRRLPPALLCQSQRAVDGAKCSPLVRDAVMEVCRECLPSLTEAPDKAVRWMDRITACMSWYQLDGPLRPENGLQQARAPAPTAEERAARRRVEEWDEAYRSLEVLLRQGVVPTFSIVTDRFTVSVFGEGSGPWVSSRPGSTSQQQPTREAPCAVMCPSMDELRMMLQENHVPFEVALLRIDSPAAGGADGASEPKVGGRWPAESEAIVPSTHGSALVAAPGATAAKVPEEDTRAELWALRRDGESVVSPEDMLGKVVLSEALWFEGAWRVHALLDVLRQHFLAAPLPASPPPPSRLPRLISPSPFGHATARCAEVIKTQTLQNPAGGSVYTAELGGFFFPRQVRMLLEMLRVLLPSFSCAMLADARHHTGINAFTQLGMRHIESVECERTQGGCAAAAGWKWDFKLGT